MRLWKIEFKLEEPSRNAINNMDFDWEELSRNAIGEEPSRNAIGESRIHTGGTVKECDWGEYNSHWRNF